MKGIKNIRFLKREYCVQSDFNSEDKSSYDGIENFLCVSDEVEDWLFENDIVILKEEERMLGVVFSIPYIKEEGIKFWISDPKRIENLEKEKELKKQKKIELLKKQKEIEDAKPEFSGVYNENGLFLVDRENFIKIKRREPTELDVAVNKEQVEFEGIYCIEILDIINIFENRK